MIADDAYLKAVVSDIQNKIIKIVDHGRSAVTELYPPSDYWRDNFRGFSYLFQPESYGLFKRLRHHTHHIVGGKPEDYPRDDKVVTRRYKSISAPKWIRERLTEPIALGGFGVKIGGKLINQDIIRSLIAVSTLYHGDKLDPQDAPTVLEIGCGYGSLAHHFKNPIPRSNYIMVDLPESLLYLAAYLKLLNPGKTVYIYEPESDKQLWDEEQAPQYDFMLLPPWEVAAIPDGSIDLVIVVFSLQEMTRSQVVHYLQQVRRVLRSDGSFYSWNMNNRENHKLIDIHPLIAEHFDMMEYIFHSDYESGIRQKISRRMSSMIGKSRYPSGTRIYRQGETTVNRYLSFLCTPKSVGTY